MTTVKSHLTFHLLLNLSHNCPLNSSLNRSNIKPFTTGLLASISDRLSHKQTKPGNFLIQIRLGNHHALHYPHKTVTSIHTNAHLRLVQKNTKQEFSLISTRFTYLVNIGKKSTAQTFQKEIVQAVQCCNGLS